MNTDDIPTMIYESTVDRQMTRTMERVEEMIHDGKREITLDIHEFQHILGMVVSLEHDRLRLENMLFGTLTSLRQSFNNRPSVPQIIRDPRQP